MRIFYLPFLKRSSLPQKGDKSTSLLFVVTLFKQIYIVKWQSSEQYACAGGRWAIFVASASLPSSQCCQSISFLPLLPRKVFRWASFLVPQIREFSRNTRFADSTTFHPYFQKIPRTRCMFHPNSFFPRTAEIRNTLSWECFPAEYNLGLFESRVNKFLSWSYLSALCLRLSFLSWPSSH